MPVDAWEHVDAAFESWQRRSASVWELELAILTAAGVTVTPAPPAAQRPARAAAALDELARQGGPTATRPPGRGEQEQVEPAVSVRALTVEEVARGEDPLSRLLRGRPPR